MFDCERVDVDFFHTAPQRFSNSVDLVVTPEDLFAVLCEADTLRKWVPVIRGATWTSTEPHGVGATRDVDVRGGITGREEFLAWEPFRQITFRFNESSTSALAAFAEDFRIEPAPQGCRLTWSVAMKLSGLARLAVPFTRPAMNAVFRHFLAKLRRYAEERFIADRRL